MQKITPCLWFDSQAEDAAGLYVSLFKNSRITDVARYGESGAQAAGMPEGSVITVAFRIAGQEFLALNGGPVFKFTPAISFLIAAGTRDEARDMWNRLSEGGAALMEFGEYPFSQAYGWAQDRYGLSWQIMFVGEREISQKITPTLMFVGDVCGKAEEALNSYASIFHNSSIGEITRYGANEGPDRPGSVKHAGFTLEGQEFAAMDSAYKHEFGFNEAVSFTVNCKTQKETDYFWDKLSADPRAEQCGWLKDRYGVSWQIVPTVMGRLLRDPDPAKADRVMKAMLQMKKIDIAALKAAYAAK